MTEYAIPIFTATFPRLPAAVLLPSIGVHHQLHALAMEVVGERLHTPRPEREVLLQLARERVAPDPVRAHGGDGGVPRYVVPNSESHARGEA